MRRRRGQVEIPGDQESAARCVRTVGIVDRLGTTHNCAGRELCLGVRRGGLSGAWGGVIGPTAPPGLNVEI